MAGAGPLSKPAGDPAFVKMVNLMGLDRANAALEQAMRRAKLSSIESPNDRFRLGCALMQSGGVFEAVGRAIKIQAILHGASPEPPNSD
jgi:hypothetical protein